jgi:hypothetical protein
VLKKFRARAKAFARPTPHACAAYFTSLARKSKHWSLCMHVRRRRNFRNARINAKKIFHRRNFAKWNAGLRHAEWTGVHSYKQHARRRLRHAQVRAVRLPRVVKRVVYKCNGRAKVNAGASVAQSRGGVLQ